MFPLNWNIPFIRKNGSRTTLGAITGDIAGIEEDVAELTEKTDGLWDNMLENGSVNSLGITKNELHTLNTEGTWSGETYTNNDATFACEYDGEYLKKVTVNKSTGGNSIFTLKKTPKFPYLPIKLTGCPSGGASKYYIYYANWSTSDGVVYDTGGGATITSQFDYSTYPSARIVIRINSGQTVSNLVFYPMLSDPSLNLSYGDYVPYAMTNKELTENVTPQEVAYTINSSVVNAGPKLKLYKTGKEIVSTGYFSTKAATAQYDTLFTITNERPTDEFEYFLMVNSSGNAFLARFNSDGTVKLDSATMPTGGYIVFGSLIIQ